MHLSPMWIPGILWIAFIVYWNGVACTTAPTASAESVKSRQLHQLLMWGSILLLFVRFRPLILRLWPRTPLIVAIGVIVHVAAMLLAVSARKHLGRNWSGAITAKAGHQLVRTGPYRLVRHPIYTGMLGMFAGTTLVAGELHAVVAFVVMAVAYWRKIGLEEQHLRGLFGEAYDAYCQDAWALIPGIL
jgi:protein-S-isoprenylcysteine O-methyltransferase Ste14